MLGAKPPPADDLAPASHSSGDSASRRRFLKRLFVSAGFLSAPQLLRGAAKNSDLLPASADLELLRETAARVLASAKVAPGAQIPKGPKNTTGHTLRVPGGTQIYYPAFWVRDAAMMLGGDFVPADEVEGWIRVVAATQPGADGLRFGRLLIPPCSIPDHITLAGEACWYPGAYVEQGNGSYGFLPPADDAFYFIQMVREHQRLTRNAALFKSNVRTAWGDQRLSEVCMKAFESVATDAKTGLVVCEADEGRTRVDWGFCDTIRKTGLCLMPSLLRSRAAQDLEALFAATGDRETAQRLRAEAKRIQSAIVPTFFHKLAAIDAPESGLLFSATGLGRKDDVWASAFAVWLDVLPRDTELAVARHLLDLYEAGGAVAEGQVRHLPLAGEFGGFWEQASCEKDTYQNGGFWAAPTGWLIAALRKVKPEAADRLLHEYADHLRANRDQGAPWEWIQPAKNRRANPLYAASAGLVYLAIARK